MAHECDACGETFTSLSRLRMHDCPASGSEDRDPLSSFDAFLDTISDELKVDMSRRSQEREQRGLEAASQPLKDSLESAAGGDVDAGFQMLAHYERDLREQTETEDYDAYRGLFWAFYEPAAEALDQIARREGWPFLADIVEAYPRESTEDEPYVSTIVENAVGRSVIRTRLQDGVEAIPPEMLSYLGSFWASMGDTSGEEGFTYGWGIGHPDVPVAEHLHDVVTEELFWVRGALPHAFYADQHAAADLFEALVTADQPDYEDRYILATMLSEVDRGPTTEIPRYWDWAEELGYRFEWDEGVRQRLRGIIEDEGFHRRLPEDWEFSDMEL